MNFAFKMTDVDPDIEAEEEADQVLKLMNSALQMMNSVLQMMNSVIKMMNYVLKMMNSVIAQRERAVGDATLQVGVLYTSNQNEIIKINIKSLK